VELTPYSIGYQIQQTRIPTLNDYSALETFNDHYLNMYLKAAFSKIPEITFASSATNTTGSEFRLGVPVLVNYSTTITFSPLSTVVPGATTLNVLLMSAYEGSNSAMYISALKAAVGPANIFSTTSSITFATSAPTKKVKTKVKPKVAPKSAPATTNDRQKPGITAGMASAVFVLIIAGCALYVRRKKNVDDLGGAKNLMGHMAVDGESATYVGDDRTQDARSQFTTKYRFDGESSESSSTAAEWGESPEDVVPHTASFPMLAPRYSGEDDDSDESKVEEEEVEHKMPETRRKRYDDVSL
jgi:hypothetical protein